MTEAQITKKTVNLPTKVEDLQKWILIGKAKLKAQIEAIKAVDKLGDKVAARDAALNDTQDLAEILLYVEADLGAILEDTPKEGKKEYGSSGGTIPTLPEGIDKKQSHYAQELNRNRDIIADVVDKAREAGEVPVRSHVLKAAQKAKTKPSTPELPEGKFNVIYADPHWKSTDTKMTIDEIANLPVADITADDAVLFMWVTNPLLNKCLTIIEKWGFDYKTNLCWVKAGQSTCGKLGFFVYGKHELLLIATKGTMLSENKLKGLINIKKKSEHGKKPDIAYDIIECMYPKKKYLELFARKKHSCNWEVWGK